LSAGLKATYYNQKGEFQRQDAAYGEFASGKDDFWLVDAAIKLPFAQALRFYHARCNEPV